MRGVCPHDRNWLVGTWTAPSGGVGFVGFGVAVADVPQDPVGGFGFRVLREQGDGRTGQQKEDPPGGLWV